MRPILFTQNDFFQLNCLKNLHSYIEEELDNLPLSSDLIKSFTISYKTKFSTFNIKYKDLCLKIKNAPKYIDYFGEDIERDGSECFRLIDELGDFADSNIQELQLSKYFVNLHQNMFIDEIFF